MLKALGKGHQVFKNSWIIYKLGSEQHIVFWSEASWTRVNGSQPLNLNPLTLCLIITPRITSFFS